MISPFYSDIDTKELVKDDVDKLLKELVENGYKLVVHNDEVNTFEWVIESLVDICNHSLPQAEQCAMLIHFKGKYAVKEGGKQELKPMKDALIDRGINATLDS